MVISLDHEILTYEPFGRSVVSTVPNRWNRQNDTDIEENDLFNETPERLFEDNFVIADLDITRDLFRSINDFASLKDANSTPVEFWKLRKSQKGEEELYVKDNVIIWSYRQPNNNGTSLLKKAYTFNEKIVDAVWCDFTSECNISTISNQYSGKVVNQPVSIEANKYPKFFFSPDHKEKVKSTGSKNKSLCVLDRYSIHILTDTGDHYRKRLNFKVNKIYASNYGLLVERVYEGSMLEKSHYPLIFMLSNPWNNLTPLLKSKDSYSGNLGYMSKANDLTLAGVVQEKNLVIFFNSKTQTHYIFFLRPINEAEEQWIKKDVDSSQESMLESDRFNSEALTFNSLLGSPSLAEIPNTKKQSRLSSYINLGSPSSRSKGVLSCMFHQSKSNRQSSPLAKPTSSSNMMSSPLIVNFSSAEATSSKRISSPLTSKLSSNLFLGRIDSPISQSISRVHFSSASKISESDLDNSLVISSNTVHSRSSRNHKSTTPTITRSCEFSSQKYFEPIFAEYCFEFVWSECVGGRAISKVFYTTDFFGQQYLALLIKDSKPNASFLKLISFTQTSDQLASSSKPYRVGTSRTILRVKDAESVMMNMMLVMDTNNSMVLYSGAYKVAIVHLHPTVRVSNCLVETDKTCTTPSLRKEINYSPFSSSFTDPDLSDFLPESLLSKPGISHLHASSPIVDLNLSGFSPVLSRPDEKTQEGFEFTIRQYPLQGTITNLRDSVDNRMTFVTEDSKLYRLSFPLLTSTFLVDKCLGALIQTLPRQSALNFVTCWYTFRNSINHEENIPEIILFKLFLLNSIGYDYESIKEYYNVKNEISKLTFGESHSVAPCVSSPLVTNKKSISQKDPTVSKKLRTEDEDDEKDDDWYSLLNQDSMELFGYSKSQLLNQDSNKTNSLTSNEVKSHSRYSFNSPGVLFHHVQTIMKTFHLLYEDLKIVQMNWSLCKSLVDILYLLSVDFNFPSYQDYYFRDFASICSEISSQPNPAVTELITKSEIPKELFPNPPSIYRTLLNLLDQRQTEISELFPYIGCENQAMPQYTDILTPNIYYLVLLYANLKKPQLILPEEVLKSICEVPKKLKSDCINLAKWDQICQLYDTAQKESSTSEKRDCDEKILFLMSALGITRDYIQQLSFGLAIPLWDIITRCRVKPKNDWCSSIYALLDRSDLMALEYNSQMTDLPCRREPGVPDHVLPLFEEINFLDKRLFRLLFVNENPLQEAYRLLISHLLISIKPKPKAEETETGEEYEKMLFSLTIRVMSLPLGRAMITLRSYSPVVMERFPIPPLVLQGRVRGRSQNIQLQRIDVPYNLTIWPIFHNGVASGLRICSSPNQLADPSWILLNRPPASSNMDEHYAHAGFLYALGLNGLLDNLSIMDMHECLSRGNDLTRVALLLGLAASKRGTMDTNAFVLLGLHLEGLLPSTSTELDVAPIVKVAALLGVGLLFQSTGHRYICEVMLSEIGRPPGPEMDQQIDRESYALAAGLSFGLVTLGRGNELMNVLTSEGISIPDQLNHYMLGVYKKTSAIQREKNRAPSYTIREGDCVNTDITSPSATMALAMMFFNTNNTTIAHWLSIPTTQNLLEAVRPDFIMLRVIAKSLVMWSQISATTAWIESNIPPIIYKYAFQKNSKSEKRVSSIDYETMTQAYCNIIAGACFAMALRYAGTADSEAFHVAYQYTLKLVVILQKGTAAEIEQAGKSTIEACLSVLIVSCAIIMAGTGNQDVMRVCRFLRSRVQLTHVSYGSFMAIHMALGLLFLGGCRMTLSSSPESVAAMLIAFFPKYPIHSSDNRYHLQAFRHLYVLAAEQRLIVPFCIDSRMPQHAKIRYTFLHSKKQVETIAPCLLPELSLLESVELIDDRYWNISFEWNKNFHKLWRNLQANGFLYVKRKVKCLSYNKEQISRRLTSDSLKEMRHIMDRKSFTLFELTTEVLLKTFNEMINAPDNGMARSDQELLLNSQLTSLLYNCAEEETLELFMPLTKLVASWWMLKEMEAKCSKPPLPESTFESELIRNNLHKHFIIWQIKIASLFINQLGDKTAPKYQIIETIRFELESRIKECVLSNELNQFLRKQIPVWQCTESLLEAVVYFNLPFDGLIDNQSDSPITFFKLLQLLNSRSSFTTRTALFLRDILRKPSVTFV